MNKFPEVRDSKTWGHARFADTRARKTLKNQENIIPGVRISMEKQGFGRHKPSGVRKPSYSHGKTTFPELRSTEALIFQRTRSASTAQGLRTLWKNKASANPDLQTLKFIRINNRSKAQEFESIDVACRKKKRGRQIVLPKLWLYVSWEIVEQSSNDHWGWN